MEQTATTAETDQSSPPASAAGALASELATKHGAGAAGAPDGQPRGRGRRSAADEARAWLQAQGLVAVPQDLGSAPADTVGGVDGSESGPAPALVNGAFIVECAEVLLTGLVEWRAASIHRRALRVCGDDGLAHELAIEAAPPTGTIGVMSKSLGMIVEKHGVDLGPEWVLAGAGLNWMRLDSKIDKRLKELESRAKSIQP